MELLQCKNGVASDLQLFMNFLPNKDMKNKNKNKTATHNPPAQVQEGKISSNRQPYSKYLEVTALLPGPLGGLQPELCLGVGSTFSEAQFLHRGNKGTDSYLHGRAPAWAWHQTLSAEDAILTRGKGALLELPEG